MMRRLDESHQDESGAIAIMAAVMILTTLLATSLAVDVGRAAFASRDQQGVTDRAALDSAAVLRAASYGSLGDVHTAVELAIVDSLGRNPGTSTGVERDREIGLVEIGLIDEATHTFLAICAADYDPASTPACVDGVNNGYTPVDVSAVRVETQAFVPFTFAIGDEEGGRDVIKQAVAETLALASVRVGSELAGLDEGVLNDMLETILCTSYTATTSADVDANGTTITGSSGTRVDGLPSCDLGVSLVGYQGLADASVTLGDLVDGLGLSAGSPDQALDTDVTVADLVTVMGEALDDDASPAAVALNEFATEINQSLVVNLGKLLAVETGTVGQAAEAEFNMLELLRGSAQLVNGTNLLDVPDLGLSIPGLADIESDLQVIEAPRQAAGPPGVTTAETSQVNLEMDPELTLDLASTVLGVGSLLTLGTVTATAEPVVLPLDLDVAAAQARLDAIQCGDPTDATQSGTSADVTTSTDVAALRIGDGDWVDVSSVNVRVAVLGVPLSETTLRVQARMNVPVGGVTDDANTFFGPFPSGPEHTVGGATDFSNATASSLELQVVAESVLGSLGDGVIADLSSAITAAVEPAALDVVTALDDAVAQPVLNTLGVGLGNADTWTQSVECQGRRLLPLDG